MQTYFSSNLSNYSSTNYLFVVLFIQIFTMKHNLFFLKTYLFLLSPQKGINLPLVDNNPLLGKVLNAVYWKS